MAYSVGKSISKAGAPIAIVIFVNIVLAVCKARGIEVSEEIVWQAAMLGYGSLQGIINWIKNRKRQ